MLPNFVIAGAAKSGTSALTHMVAAHPDVYIPVQEEPHWFLFPDRRPAFTGPGDDAFNSSVITSRVDYERLFDAAGDRRAVGDSSVGYLGQPACFELMASTIPSARVVLLLRNPVERAHSAWSHMRRDGREPERSFRRALDLEEQRIADGWEYIWWYKAFGFYGAQVEELLRHYPREQVLLLRHDDFRADAAAVLRQVFEFLQVDPSFTPDVTVQKNVSAVPRSALLHTLLRHQGVAKKLLQRAVGQSARKRLSRRVNALNMQKVPPEPEAVELLIEVFRDDVRALESLTGWDLSGWLRPRPASSPSRAPS